MNEYERSLGFKATESQRLYVQQLPASELPSISVVVPSFNQGRFIRQAVNSALRQNYPRLEIFVADGGSTDDTVATLTDLNAQYPDIVRFDSRPDGGHFPGVNKAISMTSGDIVAWLNSDDIYAPDAFWNVACFFVFNTCALIAYGRNDYVKEDGEFLVDYPIDWSPLLSEQRKRMWNSCIIGQPSLFFKRHAVTLCGALNHKLLDYELWLRWQKDLPFYFIDEKLSYSRLHSQAITANADGDLLGGIARLVRGFYGTAPMSWCIRAAYNAQHGADWTNGGSAPITQSLLRNARWRWLQYNVLEQPLSFIRLLISNPQGVVMSYNQKI